MTEINKAYFAPQLYIKSAVRDIEFYANDFGAIELRRWTNDDGSLHVAGLSIDGAMFHLHKESLKSRLFDPEKYNRTTTNIGAICIRRRCFNE